MRSAIMSLFIQWDLLTLGTWGQRDVVSEGGMPWKVPRARALPPYTRYSEEGFALFREFLFIGLHSLRYEADPHYSAHPISKGWVFGGSNPVSRILLAVEGCCCSHKTHPKLTCSIKLAQTRPWGKRPWQLRGAHFPEVSSYGALPHLHCRHSDQPQTEPPSFQNPQALESWCWVLVG